jgi:hypothetical protein
MTGLQKISQKISTGSRIERSALRLAPKPSAQSSYGGKGLYKQPKE